MFFDLIRLAKVVNSEAIVYIFPIADGRDGEGTLSCKAKFFTRNVGIAQLYKELMR